LKTGDQTLLTLARELQRHPVKGSVTHIDFVIVRRDEVISAEIPVNLIGEALEVQHGDGMIEQQLFTLPVRAFPMDIPNFVELDISGLTIGASLRVADLKLPDTVTVDIDLEVTVAVGQPPRVTEPEPGAEAVEGEEGVVAEGETTQEGESASAGSGDGE
ncbi:MAG: 50S ribosomal protein L25, partial [Acidimicrobiales bacterium]